MPYAHYVMEHNLGGGEKNWKLALSDLDELCPFPCSCNQ